MGLYRPLDYHSEMNTNRELFSTVPSALGNWDYRLIRACSLNIGEILYGNEFYNADAWKRWLIFLIAFCSDFPMRIKRRKCCATLACWMLDDLRVEKVDMLNCPEGASSIIANTWFIFSFFFFFLVERYLSIFQMEPWIFFSTYNDYCACLCQKVVTSLTLCFRTK